MKQGPVSEQASKRVSAAERINKTSRVSGRARFYFLLPTSKDFRGSLPTKPVCVYALYRLIMIELIMMDKINATVILESF